MNNSAISQKKDSKTEIKDINIPEEKNSESNVNGRQNLLIMTIFSLLVMFTAVGLIYYYVKFNPDVVHKNDQTTTVSENAEYVNPNSIQQLENDTSNITVKPVENSSTFIICGGVFMVVMVGTFIYVKIAESKDDN